MGLELLLREEVLAAEQPFRLEEAEAAGLLGSLERLDVRFERDWWPFVEAEDEIVLEEEAELLLLWLEARGDELLVSDFLGITNEEELFGANGADAPEQLLDNAGGGTSLVGGAPDDGARGSAATGGMHCAFLFKLFNVSNTFGR